MIDLITMSEMARQANVPETSARRYVEQFNEFFIIQKAGARKLFASSGVPLLRSIAEAFKRGKDRDDIAQLLHKAEATTIDAAPQYSMPDMATSTIAPSPLAESLAQSLAVLPKLLEQKNDIDNLQTHLTQIRQALHEEQTLRKTLEKELHALRERVIQLEAHMETLLPEEQKHITTAQPQTIDDRHQVFEKFSLEL
ncbi:hypothetical protein [Desulfovibrio inopinatus]|uniref:hypothetical protein n=1 Tax=Desulfovibrio inopinatus TaxID=102109 RepID=UPI00040CE984|nr:hypothetical protein [Desulfovibrio inopinatus]